MDNEAQTKIEQFVKYIDDPSWIPKIIKGHKNITDLSMFRRCIPLNIFPEFNSHGGFFTDATLELAGVRSQSIITIKNDLPSYTHLKLLNKLPTGFSKLAGVPHMLYNAVDVKVLDPSRKSGLFCSESAVYYNKGSWIPAKLIDPRWEGGVDPAVADTAMITAGVAFTYQYNASMEIESGNGTSVAIPLNLIQIREVLKDRDKPESGSRRPALIHLVNSHKRITNNDDHALVREHLRGKIECNWRGWNVTIAPSLHDVVRLVK